MDNLKQYVISWDEYDIAAHQIFCKLKDLQFNPDVIIGVSRGGLILGTHLCHLFEGKPEMGTIYARRHINDAHFSKLIEPKVSMHMLPNLKGKKVLITEDTIGTGATNSCIKKFLLKKTLKKIMTAVISVQKDVDLKDCVYYKLNDKIWQVFPWER